MRANACVVAVVVAIVRHEDRYLVSKRRKGVHLASMWEFPGGKPEPGESDEAALEREVCEETGMLVRVLDCMHQVTHSYPERTVNLRFYHCEPLPHSPTAQALEVAEVRWVTLAQLKTLDFPEANRSLLTLLQTTSDESARQH